MLLKCAAHDDRCNIAKISLQNLANLSSAGSSSPGFFQANFHTTVQNVVTPGFICLVIPVYSVRAHMAQLSARAAAPISGRWHCNIF